MFVACADARREAAGERRRTRVNEPTTEPGLRAAARVALSGSASLIVPGALTGRRTGVVLPVITKKYRTVGPRVRDGLAAVAEWEAEHGPLTRPSWTRPAAVPGLTTRG